MLHRSLQVIAAIALSLMALPAHAVTVDGVLDAEYGPALVVQQVQTSSNGGQISGNSTQNDLDFANGSELDAAHAFVSNGVLHLFLAGNLALMLNQNQNGTVRHILDVFVDVVPGGQNPLAVFSGNPINGLAFDGGFEPDYWLELEGDDNGFFGPREWSARYAALPHGGGGTLVTLGYASAGSGTLQGGTNPHGIRATIDNHNVGGVSAGCGLSSGAGVTTGAEFEIPLAALGNPGGCIRVTAFVRSGSSLSNQVLAPVPVGTCPLGLASSVNFASIPGDQFFSVCAAADVADGARAGLALALLGPNPSRGERLRVAFTLPDAQPARLQLVDAAGRMLHEQSVGGSGGAFVVDAAGGRRLAPGLYWIRLAHGDRAAARKVVVMP